MKLICILHSTTLYWVTSINKYGFFLSFSSKFKSLTMNVSVVFWAKKKYVKIKDQAKSVRQNWNKYLFCYNQIRTLKNVGTLYERLKYGRPKNGMSGVNIKHSEGLVTANATQNHIKRIKPENTKEFSFYYLWDFFIQYFKSSLWQEHNTLYR